MTHFTKRIQTSKGHLSFFFNRLFTADGLRYHVSVVDNNRKAIMFNMEQSEGRWYFVNPANCPDWLVNIEPLLSDCIIEHLMS
jgi:hypothetical protein